MAIQEIISTKNRMNGVQVRVGQGPGQTRYLSYPAHGGKEATLLLAKKVEQELEAKWGKKQHNFRGRKMKNNKSGIPGIRLEWRSFSSDYAYLYLVGNYTDPAGKFHSFSYSVDFNGYDLALQRGLDHRHKNGVPFIALEDAKKLLAKYYQRMKSCL